MNRYKPSVPRVAFGIAAVAMTAITIGVSIVMPAKMDSDSVNALAASKVTSPASTRVVTVGSIEVVAVREPASSPAPCTSSNPNRTPES